MMESWQYNLPMYKCHKIVRAIKIATVTPLSNGQMIVAPLDRRWAIEVKSSYPYKGNDEDLGYYVVYEDGYESWSPTKAFEDGYTLE